MPSALTRRLERLEAAEPPDDDVRALTWDELNVSILDFSRSVVADPDSSQAERDEAAGRVIEIEAGIRHQAEYAASPDRNRAPQAAVDEHVPALCAHPIGAGVFADAFWAECDDHDKPRLMQRRAALRARPDIAALIEEGRRQGHQIFPPAAPPCDGRVISGE